MKFTEHALTIKRLAAVQATDNDNREACRAARLFVSKRDGQWEDQWWNQNSGKPRYTFDLTSPVVDQIAGEIEQADFDIRVSPAGGQASNDMALKFDGLVRNTENISGAKQIYAASGRGMIEGGIDGWRVVHKFVDGDSFDMDLVIEKINNVVDRVWFGPSEKQDNSDAPYCFVLHPISCDEYEERWPDGSKQSVSDGRNGDAYYDKAETIVVGELLFYKEEERELVLMSNGQVHAADENFQAVVDDLELLGITEVRRRKRKQRIVYSRFFDNSDWLEGEKETVFSMFPIALCYGNYKVLENKTVWYGAVEKMIDPQRVFNYSVSREIEEGALAPRSKYWMTQKQSEGHETELATLNTNSDPVQFYNADADAPGAPQQQGGAQINPGLRTISEAMRGVIGNVSGMFASNMGDNPGLQSGVAIDKLQSKGDSGTIKYFKSLEVPIAYTGRVLVDSYKRVIDTEREARILREDGTTDMVVFNQQVMDQQTGKPVTINDLSQGKYDVVCSAGPSFMSRQQETTDTILKLAAVDPSILQIGGDVILQNIGSAASKTLSERKRALMIAQGAIPESQLTDEEKAERDQKKGQEKPDAAMELAKAEQMKAQAEMMKAETERMKLQKEIMALQVQAQSLEAKAGNDAALTHVAEFNAETSRYNAQVKAQQAHASVVLDDMRLEGVQIDNQSKMLELAQKVAPVAGNPIV